MQTQFHPAVILLDDIVQILRRTYRGTATSGTMLFGELADRTMRGLVAVKRDRVRRGVTLLDRIRSIVAGSRSVAEILQVV